MSEGRWRSRFIFISLLEEQLKNLEYANPLDNRIVDFLPLTNDAFLKHETFSGHDTKWRDRNRVEASEKIFVREDIIFPPKKNDVKKSKKCSRAGNKFSRLNTPRMKSIKIK